MDMVLKEMSFKFMFQNYAGRFKQSFDVNQMRNMLTVTVQYDINGLRRLVFSNYSKNDKESSCSCVKRGCKIPI